MNKLSKKYLAPDTGVGDTAADVLSEHPTGETSAPTTQTQESPPPSQTNDQLAKAISDLATKVGQPATPAAPTRQPTQEEIDEHWGVFNPEKADPDFFSKYLRLPGDMDPAEKKAALDSFKQLFGMMQTGLVKQSLKGSQNLMTQMREELMKEFKPVSEYVSTQRQEQVRSRFYGAYPALAAKTEDGKNQFEALIAAHAQNLSNQKFDNEDLFFKTLAESVAGTIKGVLPTFDLGAKPTTTKPAGTTPRLPRSNVGGTGGAGKTQAQSGGDDVVTRGDDANTAIKW